MSRFRFRAFTIADLDIVDPLPMFALNYNGFNDNVGITIYYADTEDIVAILAMSKYPICDSCLCHKQLDVSFLSSIIAHPIKEELLSAMRYGRWVLDELCNIYGVDALVVGRDQENQLGDKFLRLLGFSEVKYPNFVVEGRSFLPYFKKINKKLVMCGDLCYLPPIDIN